MAGVFPVVISGPMDDVYKGLPVLVVKKWPDVTEKLLRDTLETFQARRDWAMDKLFFPYWRDLISSVSKSEIVGSVSKNDQTTPPPSFPLPHDKIRQLRDEYDSG